MPTITVRPDATGTYSEADTIVGSSALIAVTDSDDGTYISAAAGATRVHTFALPDVTANGTIDNVKFNFRISDGNVMNEGHFTPRFRISSSNYDGYHQHPQFHSIATFSQDWALSPATDATWTWAEISGMEMGGTIYSFYDSYYPTNHPCNLYEIWLEVSYTETEVFFDCCSCGPCMI